MAGWAVAAFSDAPGPVPAGIDRALIEVRGKSDNAPVAACAGPLRTTRELEECLAPNRRVEIEIAGLRTP